MRKRFKSMLNAHLATIATACLDCVMCMTAAMAPASSPPSATIRRKKGVGFESGKNGLTGATAIGLGQEMVHDYEAARRDSGPIVSHSD